MNVVFQFVINYQNLADIKKEERRIWKIYWLHLFLDRDITIAMRNRHSLFHLWMPERSWKFLFSVYLLKWSSFFFIVSRNSSRLREPAYVSSKSKGGSLVAVITKESFACFVTVVWEEMNIQETCVSARGERG